MPIHPDTYALQPGVIYHRDFQDQRNSWGIRTSVKQGGVGPPADLVLNSGPVDSLFPQTFLPLKSATLWREPGNRYRRVDRYELPRGKVTTEDPASAFKYSPALIKEPWIEGSLTDGTVLATTYIPAATTQEIHPPGGYTFMRPIWVLKIQPPFELPASPWTDTIKGIKGKVNNDDLTFGEFNAEPYTMLFQGITGEPEYDGQALTHRGFYDFVYRHDGWYRQALGANGTVYRVLKYEPAGFPEFVFRVT